MEYRARFAPSPTGALHLGNARTALIAWLDARRTESGRFVLRMEDLDPQRSSPGAAAQILDDLRWLGLDWDEGPDVGGPLGPYTQSELRPRYRTAIDALLKSGGAFECSCSRADVARAANAPHAGEDGPRYPGTCRKGPTQPGRPRSVRLRVEPGEVRFVDAIHGSQSFDVASEVGDFVIQRADGIAAYQLAVAVDDAHMRIDRVVRGDDLLSSTPRQILVYRALGLTPPEFAHLPLLLGEDGHRLAKRGGSLTIAALRERGVTPAAIVGFLAGTAGLSEGRPQEARSLASRFSFDGVRRKPFVVTDALLTQALALNPVPR